MGPISATSMIDAPREAVHALLCDLSARPAFTAGFIDEFRLERIEPVGVGAAARFRIPGRGLWMETVIAESEAPHRLVERGRCGRLDRVDASTVWDLAEGPSASACEVTVTFVTEPRTPVDRLLDVAATLRGAERWYRRQWKRSLARLKELAEGDEAVERVSVAGADRI